MSEISQLTFGSQPAKQATSPQVEHLKVKIQDAKWEIEDLEDQISELQSAIEKYESELEALKLAPLDADLTAIAQNILQFPNVPGFIHESAFRILDEQATEEDVHVISIYYTARERELAFKLERRAA